MCVCCCPLRYKAQGNKDTGADYPKGSQVCVFSADGKPITLSEQDVYSIRQMYEDGMQPYSIGEKFGLETVMVMRIINCVKSM